MRASSQTEFKSFDDAKKEIMDETDIKVYEKLKTWCARYPNITTTNINIIGGAGSGKTFMLECVANELIKKGVLVCYKTAFELNELARLYHIGKSYDFSDCLNAEVLLIDDLGTEMPGQFVTAALYSLLNDRILEGKPMVISTNLNVDELAKRYSPQIASRLHGSFTRLTFVGDDIRVMKNRGL